MCGSWHVSAVVLGTRIPGIEIARNHTFHNKQREYIPTYRRCGMALCCSQFGENRQVRMQDEAAQRWASFSCCSRGVRGYLTYFSASQSHSRQCNGCASPTFCCWCAISTAMEVFVSLRRLDMYIWTPFLKPLKPVFWAWNRARAQRETGGFTPSSLSVTYSNIFFCCVLTCT